MRRTTTLLSSRPSSTSTRETLLSVAPDLYLGDDPVNSQSGIHMTFSLRIDQSKLAFTCQPDVNVIAGVHWDSGGFVVNISPSVRQVSFMGNVGGLTVSLKHGFLSEDCVRLDARNVAFSVTFSKKGGHSGKTTSCISVVLDTEFSGGVRFSRLQDILCFKAVWLDRIPVINGQNMISASQSTQTSTGVHPGTVVANQDIRTALLVRIRRINLNADLGQSITSIALDMRDVFLCSKLEEFRRKCRYLSQISVCWLRVIFQAMPYPKILVQNRSQNGLQGRNGYVIQPQDAGSNLDQR